MIMRLRQRISLKFTSLLLVSVYVMFVSFSIPETNAYLRNSTKREVMTTLGNLNVRLNDEALIEAFPLGQPTKRPVTVTNQGNTSMFIRVLIQPKWVDQAGISRPLDIAEFIQDMATTHWKAGEDGYYYYTTKLAAGTATSPIFTTLIPPKGLTLTDTISLKLKVEAVSAVGDAYREAWWQGKVPAVGTTPELNEIDGALAAVKE